MPFVPVCETGVSSLNKAKAGLVVVHELVTSEVTLLAYRTGMSWERQWRQVTKMCGLLWMQNNTWPCLWLGREGMQAVCGPLNCENWAVSMETTSIQSPTIRGNRAGPQSWFLSWKYTHSFSLSGVLFNFKSEFSWIYIVSCSLLAYIALFFADVRWQAWSPYLGGSDDCRVPNSL